jgi:hypothetical protein
MEYNTTNVLIIFNVPQRNDSSVARDIYNMLHQRNLIPKLIKIVQKENQPNCATAFIYFHEQTADLKIQEDMKEELSELTLN